MSKGRLKLEVLLKVSLKKETQLYRQLRLALAQNWEEVSIPLKIKALAAAHECLAHAYEVSGASIVLLDLEQIIQSNTSFANNQADCFSLDPATDQVNETSSDNVSATFSQRSPRKVKAYINNRMRQLRARAGRHRGPEARSSWLTQELWFSDFDARCTCMHYRVRLFWITIDNTLLRIFNADGSSTEDVNMAEATPNEENIVSIWSGNHFNSVIPSQVR
jgi:hypothetical protein